MRFSTHFLIWIPSIGVREVGWSLAPIAEHIVSICAPFVRSSSVSRADPTVITLKDARQDNGSPSGATLSCVMTRDPTTVQHGGLGDGNEPAAESTPDFNLDRCH